MSGFDPKTQFKVSSHVRDYMISVFSVQGKKFSKFGDDYKISYVDAENSGFPKNAVEKVINTSIHDNALHYLNGSEFDELIKDIKLLHDKFVKTIKTDNAWQKIFRFRLAKLTSKMIIDHVKLGLRISENADGNLEIDHFETCFFDGHLDAITFLDGRMSPNKANPQIFEGQIESQYMCNKLSNGFSCIDKAKNEITEKFYSHFQERMPRFNVRIEAKIIKTYQSKGIKYAFVSVGGISHKLALTNENTLKGNPNNKKQYSFLLPAEKWTVQPLDPNSYKNLNISFF